MALILQTFPSLNVSNWRHIMSAFPLAQPVTLINPIHRRPLEMPLSYRINYWQICSIKILIIITVEKLSCPVSQNRTKETILFVTNSDVRLIMIRLTGRRSYVPNYLKLCFRRALKCLIITSSD